MSIFEQYYHQDETQNPRMDLYAYAPPTAFFFTADGIKSPVIQDFRTVERYQEYQECGFNVLFAQTSAAYTGEDWETCDAKAVMDKSAISTIVV